MLAHDIEDIERLERCSQSGRRFPRALARQAQRTAGAHAKVRAEMVDAPTSCRTACSASLRGRRRHQWRIDAKLRVG